MRKNLFRFIVINLMIVFASAALTVQAQRRPYRVSDNQIQTTLTSIEAKTDTFKRELDKALDTSRLNGTDSEDTINNYVSDFENSTDALKQKFDAKRSVGEDVTDVLSRAASIDQFIKSNRLNYRAKTYWNNVAADLDKLQNYYGLTGNWRTTTATTTSQLPYRVSDSQVQNLLRNVETDTDIYKRSLDRALDSSRLNGTNSEDTVNNYVSQFETSTDALKQKFDAKNSVGNDVQEVLNRAYFIDGFMKDNRLNQRVQRDWTSLKDKLNTLATYYNVSWNWTTVPTNNGNTGNNTGRYYTVSDQMVRSTLTSLETKTDVYKRDLNSALDNSILNNSRSEDAIVSYVTEFENATDRLKQNFDARRSTSQDVEDVLNKAYYIDGFMRDYRFQSNAERDWRLIRTDLEKLRDYYSVSFNFDNRQFVPMTRFDSMLTGTYRLNLNQSDDVNQVVSNAIRNYPAAQQARFQQNLERRLNSPEILAIEKRDKTVTIASSNSPQISFDADGITRNENMPNGRAVKITSNTLYDGVSLSYEGDRINDFYVNFMPINNNQLKVVRRVYLENKNETVTVASIYDKTNETAQFSSVNNNTVGNNTDNVFVVPNNTPITATLDNAISTKASQDGDKFTMTVISPSQYSGAIIEGRVASAKGSGRVTGAANISLEFDTIRLRNGQTYRFAGFVQEVKMLNGDKVSVNNEGTVKDGSQTTKTITRAGIGAALGAIIGAIANGGQGAAIGAAIGAGAGAGTVVLQGRDNIDLQPGTEFTLTASAPANTALNR
jgi:hypothetical protein